MRSNEPIPNRGSQALGLEKQQSSNLALLFDDEDLARRKGRFDFVKSRQLIRKSIKRTFNQSEDLRRIAFHRQLDSIRCLDCWRRDGRRSAGQANQPRVTAKAALLRQPEQFSERRFGTNQISRELVGCDCWNLPKFPFERRGIGSAKVQMREVAILSQKERRAIAQLGHEFPMCHPAFEPGLHRKEIRAKSRRTRFDLLNRFKHFAGGLDPTHVAQSAAATNLARSILPLGFRGICCIQLNTPGSMYLGTRGDSFSRMKPGVSSLSLS